MIDAVPRHISLQAVREQLLAIPGVEQVHDLHIWALSTQENALSAHLHMPEKTALADAQRQAIVAQLKQDYGIAHVTLQVEQDLRYCDDFCAQ